MTTASARSCARPDELWPLQDILVLNETEACMDSGLGSVDLSKRPTPRRSCGGADRAT